MRRVVALLFTIGLALSGALSGALPGTAQAKVILRVSSAAPPPDFLGKAMVAFKAELDRLAPGQFDVRLYPGSQLFRQGTEFPAIERGNLEMSTGTTFEVAQQMPQYGFLDRAYFIRNYADLRRMFDGPFGRAYAAAVAKKIGIRILAVGYLGTREVNLRSVRKVTGPRDLAGVKMRMPGDPEWLLLGRAIGVSPVPMGMPDVYLALKTGTIDGQDNPLTILRAARFYEVTKQVVMTSHLVQPVFFDIAQKVWAKLPPAQQVALRKAARDAMAGNDKARLADEANVLTFLKSKGLTITKVDLATFRAYADHVYAASPIAKAWDPKLMAAARSAK